jgi:hypothetical protein
MENLLHLYRFVRNNRKERFDVILEPFQATLQLSLLSFLPVGTKLMIHNNILYPQPPQWHQAILRLYNNDNKEDLYFLFHVLIRFTKFYDFLQTSDDAQLRSLYFRMVELSKKGIDNLILTYQDSNDYALINILQLYRAIMENPSDFRNVENAASNASDSNPKAHTPTHTPMHQTYTTGAMNRPRHSSPQRAACTSDDDDDNDGGDDDERERLLPRAGAGRDKKAAAPDRMKEIDKIFVTIKQLYSTHDYHLIYNVLSMLDSCDSTIETTKIINGLSLILEVKYQRIHKWISDNIIY